MERISGRQLYLLVGMYTLSVTLISVPAQVVDHARQHAYLSIIIGTVTALLSIWLLYKVMSRFPKKDLFEVMIDRFPRGGRAVAFIYVAYFFFISARDIRILSDFTKLILLPNTPLYVIAGLFVFTIVIMARAGLEVLGRMIEIYAPVLILILVGMPFILVKEYDYSLIMPYFDFDWAGISVGSWFIFPYTGEVIAAAFIFSGASFRFRYALISIGLSSFLLITLVMSTLLILGSELTPKILYTTLELVRHLRVTDFLDRFDLPLVGLYMPTVFTKLALNLFIVCHGLQRIFKDMPAKIMTTPVAMFVYVCSFWFFKDVITLLNLNRTGPFFAILFQLLIPIMLFLFLRPKRKEAASSEGSVGT